MAGISEERSYVLVGQFMQHWAVAETALDMAIAKALNLNQSQLFLFASTLLVHQKINTLKFLIDASGMRKVEKSRFKRRLGALAELSGDRNKIAHAIFHPTRDGSAVYFATTKLEGGDLKSPHFILSEQDFRSRSRRLKNLTNMFDELEQSLAEARTHKRLEALLEAMDTRLVLMKHTTVDEMPQTNSESD